MSAIARSERPDRRSRRILCRFSRVRTVGLPRRLPRRFAAGETQREARILKTVHRLGYRIGVPVSVVREGAAPLAPSRLPSDFVGRALELEQADSALSEAWAGRGRPLPVDRRVARPRRASPTR